MVGGQALIVNFGGAAFQVVRIGGRDWGVSIILGALSLPLAVLIRLLPPEPFERFMIKFKLFPDPRAPLPTTSPAADDRQWNEGSNSVSLCSLYVKVLTSVLSGITKVIDNLNTFSQIRGGRMRSSSIVRKSRSAQMKRHEYVRASLRLLL